MPKIETSGRYAATVTSAEFGESNNGTPYVALAFLTEEGLSITGWLYFSDKAIPGTTRTVRDAFGLELAELAKECETLEALVAHFVGKPCSITVDPEEYEGKERMRVKWINAPSSSKPIDNQGEFLKALSAKASRIPKEAPKAGAAPIRTSKPAVPFA